MIWANCKMCHHPHHNDILVLMIIVIPLKGVQNSHLTGSNGHTWPV